MPSSDPWSLGGTLSVGAPATAPTGLTVSGPVPVAVDSHVEVAGPPGLWSLLSGDRAVVAMLVGLAAAARLVAFRSTYDVFVDEYFYVDMGRSVAAGHIPPVTDAGPFLLHPPGFFMLEAAWMTLLGVGRGYDQAITAVRLLQLVLALVTVACLYRLVARAGSRFAAVVVAVLFAIDPFVLRQNGRVLLETATMAFVVGGWLLLARVGSAASRSHVLGASGAGLLLGCAVLVKDMSVALTTVPLLLVWASGWLLPRRQSLLAAAASVVPYLLFVTVTVVQGGAQQFWDQKLSGLARAAGLDVTTGFNAPGSQISPLTAALEQLRSFGATFLVLGAGGLAGLWLLWRGRNEVQRVLAVVTVCSGALVAYSVAFATAEEHFLYLLYVPALMTLAVVLDHLRRVAPLRVSAVVVGASIALLLGWSLTVDVQTRTVPDDGQRRVEAWLQHNVRSGESVAWVSGQTRYQLTELALPNTALSTPGEMVRQHVRYIVVLHKDVDEGYTFTSAATITWYAARSREVFSFDEPTYGRVSVYRTTDPAVW